MKTRVKKINNRYYPQYRWFFLWFNWTEKVPLRGIYYMDCDVYCDTKEDAESFNNIKRTEYYYQKK